MQSHYVNIPRRPGCIPPSSPSDPAGGAQGLATLPSYLREVVRVSPAFDVLQLGQVLLASLLLVHLLHVFFLAAGELLLGNRLLLLNPHGSSVVDVHLSGLVLVGGFCRGGFRSQWLLEDALTRIQRFIFKQRNNLKCFQIGYINQNYDITR